MCSPSAVKTGHLMAEVNDQTHIHGNASSSVIISKTIKYYFSLFLFVILF
jgi:hypothetical protein